MDSVTFGEASPLDDSFQSSQVTGYQDTTSSLSGRSGAMKPFTTQDLAQIGDPPGPPAAPSTNYRLPTNQNSTAATVVTLHSPQKLTGPSSIPGVEESYMTYLITTKTTSKNFAAPEVTVRRRFKDFVSLAELLQERYTGYFIPARPERNAMEGKRMNPKFVEERRYLLERYLNNLAQHYVIGDGEILQAFLEIDTDLRTSVRWRSLYPQAVSIVQSTGRLFRRIAGTEKSAPSPQEVQQSATSKGDMYRLVREKVAELGGALRQAQLSSEETNLRAATGQVEEFKKALSVVSSKSEAYLYKMTSVKKQLETFSSTYRNQASFEQEYAQLPPRAYELVSVTCAKTAVVYMEAAEEMAKPLQVVQEYLLYIPNVLTALETREKALLTKLTLQGEFQKKNDRLVRLDEANGGGFGVRKNDALRTEVAQLDSAVVAAKGEYDRLLDLNLEELKTYCSHLRRDLLSMLTEVVSIHVVMETKACDAWKELAGDLLHSS